MSVNRKWVCWMCVAVWFRMQWPRHPLPVLLTARQYKSLFGLEMLTGQLKRMSLVYDAVVRGG